MADSKMMGGSRKRKKNCGRWGGEGWEVGESGRRSC